MNFILYYLKQIADSYCQKCANLEVFYSLKGSFGHFDKNEWFKSYFDNKII